MPRFKSSYLPLLGVTLTAGLAAAPAALAAPAVSLRPSTGDGAALSVSSAAKRAIKRDHITLRTTRPATYKGAHASFPERSGKWNFATTTGSVAYSGVARLAEGKHSVKLTNLTFQRTVKGKRSAATLDSKIGKRTVALFSLTGKARVKVSGTQETISGFTAKLTKQGAKRLDSALKHRAFKANQKLGSLTIKLSSIAAGPGAPGAPVGGPGAGSSPTTPAFASSVGLNLGSAFANTLRSAGLKETPLAPGVDGVLDALSGATVPDANGTSVTLPAAGGGQANVSYNDGMLTGTVPLKGGIKLGNGVASVNLTSPVLTLGSGTDGSSLSFSVNGGPELKLFDIDTAQLEAATTPNGQLSVSNLLATLSAEGAASLDTATGQPLFTAGQPVGGLTVIVPSTTTTP